MARRRCSRRSLSEPFEEGWNVDLVRLVVARQGVHDDVDSGPEGKLPLPVAAWDRRIKRPAVGIDGPGAGIIIRADDDGRHAVGIACRARAGIEALDPELAVII